MTILEYYFQLATTLETETQVRELGWIFRETLDGIDINDWGTTPISNEHAGMLAIAVDKVAKGEPLAYILGSTDFYWCNIRVNPSVLIPRPETERLCEIVAKRIGDAAKILDLCTGSGCIAIALKNANPNWQIDASDISASAIKLASQNAQSNGVDVNFVVSDMWQNIHDKYDVIISNPPYLSKKEMDNLPTSVAEFEPHLALYGGEDGLDFYRNIAENAPRYLNENGKIYLEVGDEQAGMVAEILQENFVDIEIRKDLFDKERFVFARRK